MRRDFAGNASHELRTPLTVIQSYLETLQDQFPDQRSGLGLGLAIAKHVLLRHNAQLEIDSRPGESSAFICHFPSTMIKATTADEEESIWGTNARC